MGVNPHWHENKKNAHLWAYLIRLNELGRISNLPDRCQNSPPKKFGLNSADKIWSKKNKEIKVSPLSCNCRSKVWSHFGNILVLTLPNSMQLGFLYIEVSINAKPKKSNLIVRLFLLNFGSLTDLKTWSCLWYSENTKICDGNYLRPYSSSVALVTLKMFT